VSRLLRPESFATGVILVALGVLWTLSNMGRLDLLATLRTWWPLALVVWGVAELVSWLIGLSLRDGTRGADDDRRGTTSPSEPVLPSQLDDTTGRSGSRFGD
jgi:hypothetical protein